MQHCRGSAHADSRHSWSSGAPVGQNGGGKRGGEMISHGARVVCRTGPLVMPAWHTLPHRDSCLAARAPRKQHGGPTPSSSTLSPTGLRPPVGVSPAGSRAVPERWAGAREPLPAPASRLAASTPWVHCRRAARPPSLLTIGPEGPRLSALSLSDPAPPSRMQVHHLGRRRRAPPARLPPLAARSRPGRRSRRRRRR